jgi:hypothetical protein
MQLKYSFHVSPFLFKHSGDHLKHVVLNEHFFIFITKYIDRFHVILAIYDYFSPPETRGRFVLCEVRTQYLNICYMKVFLQG